jgi:GNAT superfamily N-acetyltransferase
MKAMAGFEIRLAAADDVEGIVELTGREFRAASIDARIQDMFGGASWIDMKGEVIREELRRNPQGCFVAIHEGSLAGYITTAVNKTASRGVIANIAVSSACRGRGIGSALLEKALAYFKAQGLRQAKIETLETNGTAARLYTSIGFKEVVRQIHFAMPLD